MALFTKARFKYSDIFEGICFTLLIILLLISKLLLSPAFGIFCLILFAIVSIFAKALNDIREELSPKDLSLSVRADKLFKLTLSVMIILFLVTFMTFMFVLIEII